MTEPHVHKLTGLKPDALATYLAALGVMRLLSQQKDASIRGFWRDEHFVLVTELDWKTIELFFLEDYAPTPILAPWNIESGFFSLRHVNSDADRQEDLNVLNAVVDANDTVSPSDDEFVDNEDIEKDGVDMNQAVGDSLLDRFAESVASRFALFSRAIKMAQSSVPHCLRAAEEDARRAHEEELLCLVEIKTEGSATERAQYNAALMELADAESAFYAQKKDVEAMMFAAKGRSRETMGHEELKRAQAFLKKTKEELSNKKRNAKDLERELKRAEKCARRDTQRKERIKMAAEATKAAKTLFGERQKATKNQLIAAIRALWDDQSREWLDAAIVLDSNGDAEFTSLFGSGGNDGRMEFTKNLRHHLNTLFDVETGAPRDDAAARFNAAVRGGPSDLLVDKPVGQFFPGRAGGTNMRSGFCGNPGINPWEFVLMLEGAVALVAGLSQRGEASEARLSSPFWVRGAAAGFGSASQREESPRGEQWLPLWSRPVRYDELVELIREGRAQVGAKPTIRSADLIRAAARLGLARGIDSLQRFAYLKRNGQATLAVSTGRVRVMSRSRQELLDDIAPWIDRLLFYANDKNAAASLGLVARRTSEALFAVCRQDAAASLWRNLLVTLGEAELMLSRSGKNPTRRPLPRLSITWLEALDDGHAKDRTTLRLALALASQHGPGGQPNGSIRRHFLPLDDAESPWPRFKVDAKSGRMQRDPEHVCFGRDLVEDAIALVMRRSLWARSSKMGEHTRRLPLEATSGCEATLDEIGAWLREEVSDRDVLGLVRPLLAINWNEVADVPPPIVSRGVADPLQMIFRLTHLPFDVPVGVASVQRAAKITVHLDPEPLRRLAAGNFDGALKVAVRRLEASGLRPVFRRGTTTPSFARRLAASLAFPISQDDAARAVQLICKPCDVEDT